MAIDCCEHMLSALRSGPRIRLTPLESATRGKISRRIGDIDLIVIGVSRYPVRRLFISQLRRIYPRTAVLVMRREEIDQAGEDDLIRGEFILSDHPNEKDYEIVRALRTILPQPRCKHTHKANNYHTVREVVRVITEKYSEPDLDLARVAKQLPISSVSLSRILNKEVGVTFRELLRHTRIEEAKRMLATHRYSVKEVATRVGFTDSHYFSRSFKELAGVSASEYLAQESAMG